jgi:hypothetical protein
VIPRDWKEANVTPIFKRGSKSSPGNYIPVSLTNPINKHLMEKRASAAPSRTGPAPITGGGNHKWWTLERALMWCI